MARAKKIPEIIVSLFDNDEYVESYTFPNQEVMLTEMREYRWEESYRYYMLKKTAEIINGELTIKPLQS